MRNATAPICHIGAKRRDGVLEVRGQGLTGLEIDLERPHQALQIARLNPHARVGIDARHHPVERLNALLCGEPPRAASAAPHPCPGRETIRASARGNKSRWPPTRIGSFPRAEISFTARRRIARELRRVYSSVGCAMATGDGECRAARRTAPCRCHVEAAIHRGRIAIDDLAFDRSAMAMPSALLPVAVGPRIATSAAWRVGNTGAFTDPAGIRCSRR